MQHLKPRSDLGRSVLTLITGATIAQSIPIIISPILTRIYTPEDFGIFAIYVSIVTLFISIASLRYELAIPLMKSDIQATNVLLLSCFIVITITFFIGIFILLYGYEIINIFNIPVTLGALWLMPLSVLLGGAYQIFNFWAIRNKEFKVISVTKIKQSLAVSAMQLIWFKLGAISLIGSQALGQGVGIYALTKNSLSTLRLDRARLSSMKRIAKRYIKFPLFSSWAALLYTLSANLPVILLTVFGFLEVAGLFLLAQRVLGAPVSIISKSINQAIHKNLSEYKRNKTLGKQVAWLIDVLVKASVGPAIFIMLIAPHFTSFIFGEQWAESGILLSYLVPYILISFVFSPMSTVISVMEWQKHGLFYQALATLISAISLAWYLAASEPLYAILAYSISRALLIVVYRCFLLHFLGVNILKIIKIFLLNIFLFSFYAMMITLLLKSASSNINSVVFLIVLSVVSYIYMNKRSQ